MSALGAFVAFLDVTIVNVAFPSIRESFPDTSLPTLSWVLNGYNVAFAALLVPAGRYADSIGHRRALVAGLVLFAVASVAAGAAPAAWVLIVARVVQAVAAAVIVPASLALLLGAVPRERRAAGVGLWGAAAAVASATGPSLGGALTTAVDWRLVFFVNVPICAAALMLARGVPERRVQRVAVPDVAGAVLLAAALGLLALGIVQGESWGWSSARVVGSFAAALVLVAAFLVRSRRRPTPAIELALLSHPYVRAANVGTLVFAAAFYGMLLNNVLYLTQVWGYSTLEAGLALTPAPLLAAAVAAPAGRIADRHGHRLVIAPGALIYAAGAAYLIVAMGTSPNYVADFLPAAVLIGIGVGLSFPALSSASVAPLDDSRFATGSGVNAAARQLGAVVGIAVVVAVLSAATPTDPQAAFRDAWLFIALCGGAAAPLALARLSGRAEAGPIATEPLTTLAPTGTPPAPQAPPR